MLGSEKKPIVIDLSASPPPPPPPPPPSQQQQQRQQIQQNTCVQCNSIHVQFHKKGRKTGIAECYDCLHRWRWSPRHVVASAPVDQGGIRLSTTTSAAAAPVPMEQSVIFDHVDHDQDEASKITDFDKRIFEWMDGIITSPHPEQVDDPTAQEEELTPPVTTLVIPTRKSSKLPVAAAHLKKDDPEVSASASPIPPMFNISKRNPPQQAVTSTRQPPASPSKETRRVTLSSSPPPAKKSRKQVATNTHTTATSSSLEKHKTSLGSSDITTGSPPPPATPKALYIPPKRQRLGLRQQRQLIREGQDQQQQSPAITQTTDLQEQHYAALMKQACQPQLPTLSTIRPLASSPSYSHYSALVNPTKPQLSLLPPPSSSSPSQQLQQSETGTISHTRPSFSLYVPRQYHEEKEQHQPTIMPP
ncbi:hypothetical protein BCR42DRAFT_430541 [Absidia repens]|uniref:Uncharacterized protein n=1 Tax=Absidia repens TaxID=90262 RepID=A0A1X2HDV0_9FUNG|nr:hypothetical protein BCR42DRAFT_430541 [Absidia repens]